jgi:basic membrane protein A and related proteins
MTKKSCNLKIKTVLFTILLSVGILLSGCQTLNATPTSSRNSQAAGFQIPAIQSGRFNIAYVLIGPHNDEGWSQAQYEGMQYVQEQIPNVHSVYIENVPEQDSATAVFQALAEAGYNLVFATSFGYQDSVAKVAGQYPNTTFIHISGYVSNQTNFGNLFGAMEDMKYLAGMLAGARAKLDGNPHIGYMATFPIPEEMRLGNAIALGMKKTCPECTIEVAWINTWHDPTIERDTATRLFDAGAQVVFTGADTPAVADVAQEKGKWGVTYDWVGSCAAERCLTAPYWNWGPVYARITQEVINKTYKPGWEYFDADSGGLGLVGFMEGQQLTPGEKDLPPEVIQEVRDTLAQMLKGNFNRFDVFSGPIQDNQGNTVVPAGEKMSQPDLDQFPPGAPGLECKYCMYWWANGITAPLPQLSGQ